MKTLKMLPIILLICILIMGGVAVSNTAEAASRFTIVNNSGKDVVSVYWTQAGADSWSGDLGYIPDGSYLTLDWVNYPYRDIQIVFEDGSGIYRQNVNLNSRWKMTLVNYGSGVVWN